jgi:hypothetical protein
MCEVRLKRQVADVCSSLEVHLCFSWVFLMAYSKAKFGSNVDNARPCFKPF